MGLITGSATSSRNLPSDGGHDTATAENPTGVDTLTASARPRSASALCRLSMAGTRLQARSGLESNTSLPT